MPLAIQGQFFLLYVDNATSLFEHRPHDVCLSWRDAGRHNDNTIGCGIKGGLLFVLEVRRLMIGFLGYGVFAVAEYLQTVGFFQEEHVAVATVLSACNGHARHPLHEMWMLTLKDAKERILKDVADAGMEFLLGVADTNAVVFLPKRGFFF